MCKSVEAKQKKKKKHEKTFSSSLWDMDIAETAGTVRTALELLEYELNASFNADLACFSTLR